MKEEIDDDAQPSRDSAAELAPGSLKKAKAYSSLRRDLSEKELVNIGSVNLMIDEIDRLQSEVGDLTAVRASFHEIDKKHAVLEEKVAAYKLAEILYSVSISVGALMVGAAISLWEHHSYGVGCLIAGLTLWVAGTATKLIRVAKK